MSCRIDKYHFTSELIRHKYKCNISFFHLTDLPPFLKLCFTPSDVPNSNVINTLELGTYVLTQKLNIHHTKLMPVMCCMEYKTKTSKHLINFYNTQ